MVRSYDARDSTYTIYPPYNSDDAQAIEAAASAIVRLFEAGTSAIRESAQRAAIEAEAKERVEQFRVAMALLEKQLDNDNKLVADRQRAWSAIADKLVERGKEELALVVLEKMSKEGKTSLVQPLIEYHKAITLGMMK